MGACQICYRCKRWDSAYPCHSGRDGDLDHDMCMHMDCMILQGTASVHARHTAARHVHAMLTELHRVVPAMHNDSEHSAMIMAAYVHGFFDTWYIVFPFPGAIPGS